MDGERPLEPEDRPEDQSAPAAPDRPRWYRRLRRRSVLLFGLPFLAIFLIGWNRVASSDGFCASCHATSEAAASAEHSIHADVACLDCHQGSGLAGSIAYVPSLLREGVDQVTGWGAGGVLHARSCTSCHPALSKAAHPDPAADCTTCHGDPAHPSSPASGPAPFLVDGKHPDGFIQVHGEPAISQPQTCSRCHESKFCEACHLKQTFPHPDGWISKHGTVQQTRGSSWCATCHGPSFCAGCHGTEIPHRTDWLGRHDTALADAPTTPCLTCHPPTDCTTCHAEHVVHREQDLYIIPTPQPTASPGSGGSR